MRSIRVGAVLVVTLLLAATLPTIGQNSERKAPAVFAGHDFSMACGNIEQAGWVVRCSGGTAMEFRMWDIRNPARVTLIKATAIDYDLSTAEVRPEGNVRITTENFPNTQTLSNRKLNLRSAKSD